MRFLNHSVAARDAQWVLESQRTKVRRHVPVGIALLLTIDVTLALAPVLNFLMGSPFQVLTNWLNLESELSIPNWYSSMQWLCAAVLFSLVPIVLWDDRPAGWSLLAAAAAICVVFSVDEIVGMHEWLGLQTDAMLPGGDRANTWFIETGIWPFVIGIPVLIVIAALGRTMWRTLGRTHTKACVRMMVGFIIMFSGALVVELFSNLIDVDQKHSGFALLQLVIEEFLEMLGVTVIVWAAYEFVRGHGIALKRVSLPRYERS